MTARTLKLAAGLLLAAISLSACAHDGAALPARPMAVAGAAAGAADCEAPGHGATNRANLRQMLGEPQDLCRGRGSALAPAEPAATFVARLLAPPAPQNGGGDAAAGGAAQAQGQRAR